MDKLITITEQRGVQLVDARELHRRLQVQTPFNHWLNRRVSEYGFDENKDYFTENQLLDKNDKKYPHRPRTEYFLTIDMAKEIAMVERTEVGKEIRNYFIEMERIARKSLIKMPPSLNVYGKEALPYIEWLLLHQYSVTSGQYHHRIRKYPQHFHRTAEGKWYINKEFAEALLQLRNGYQQLTKVQGLPQVVQLELKFHQA
ncbi:antA/AntB antirepressor family protein [uncultured Capnocytophaga sp.]|uniref:antA/AntB antirepressor family protein n=1 Tax=uncultured Capnocytophaga sp. TaxID=159273 RepID=UPI002591C411|nr:antA/AntB antirepressor family protein [uncultured Capnocytophaga sp.]